MKPDIQFVRDMLSVGATTYEVEQYLTQGFNINEQDAKALIQEAKSTPITSIFGTTVC